MNVRVFVDTNVFIYAFDNADRQKQEAARRWRDALWKLRQGRVSIQVLQGFYAKVIQLQPSSREQAQEEIRDLFAWEPLTIDTLLLERAWKIQERYRFSFWDALIVAAANALSCRYLLTEDLQSGQTLDGIVVVNPFSQTPESVLA